MMPASRLAFGLIPIDSIIMPSAERRIDERDEHDDREGEIRNTTGMPRTYPLAIQRNGSLVAVVFWPAVITLAMPRPASIMIERR